MQILARIIISRLVGSAASRQAALYGFNALKGIFLSLPWLPLIHTISNSFTGIISNSPRLRSPTNNPLVDTILRSSTGYFGTFSPRIVSALVFMSSVTSVFYRISYLVILFSVLIPVRVLIANWIIMMTPGLKYYWKDIQWIFNHLFNWLSFLLEYPASFLSFIAESALPSQPTTITLSSVLVLVWTLVPSEIKHIWLDYIFSFLPDWFFVPFVWAIKNFFSPIGGFIWKIIPELGQDKITYVWNTICVYQSNIQGYILNGWSWIKSWRSSDEE